MDRARGRAGGVQGPGCTQAQHGTSWGLLQVSQDKVGEEVDGSGWILGVL